MPSARSAGSLGNHFNEQEEFGLPNPLLIGKKAVERMNAHEKVIFIPKLIWLL